MKTYLVDIRTLRRRLASRVLDFINCFVYNEYLLLKKIKFCDNTFRNFTLGWEVLEFTKSMRVSKWVVLEHGTSQGWRKTKSCHACNTGSRYLQLRAPFQTFRRVPPSFIYESPHPGFGSLYTYNKNKIWRGPKINPCETPQANGREIESWRLAITIALYG